MARLWAPGPAHLVQGNQQVGDAAVNGRQQRPAARLHRVRQNHDVEVARLGGGGAVAAHAGAGWLRTERRVMAALRRPEARCCAHRSSQCALPPVQELRSTLHPELFCVCG